MNKLIYLDNAATTKTAPEVVQAMLPWFTENYGNPVSESRKTEERFDENTDIGRPGITISVGLF